MSQVEESIEVNVPVSTAYNQWTQFESFPQFMAGVERIEQRTGTLTHWETKIAGVEREFDAEITEQIPDERVAWTSVGGEAKQAGVVTFHYLDDTTTKIMLQLDYDPEGLAETVGDKLGFIKRQATGDLQRFKEFIESRGGAETGAWRGTV
ncbi:SRPBCC family protein [Streptomyces sp. NPDC054784]